MLALPKSCRGARTARIPSDQVSQVEERAPGWRESAGELDARCPARREGSILPDTRSNSLVARDPVADIDGCCPWVDNQVPEDARNSFALPPHQPTPFRLRRRRMNPLQQQDPQVWEAIEAEAARQQDGLEMIASENYTSLAIMQAAGSVLTNKYAEGYPGRRYYGGCQFVDVVENLAIDRAKQLFGAEAANVQPHSGSQANTAVYLSCLKPGDSVLGLDLAQGGHLTHGMRLNISGQLYNFHSYGVDPKTPSARF